MSRVRQSTKVTHKWTTKSRAILILLKRNYVRKSANALWNHIFHRQLAVEGFRSGMPPTRLDGQFQEVKNGGKGHELYNQISDATDDEVESLFPGYCNEIRVAAASLHIKVAKKTADTSVQLGRLVNSRRRRQQVPALMMSPQTTNAITANPNLSVRTRPSLQRYLYQSSPYFDNSETSRSTDKSLNLTTQDRTDTTIAAGPIAVNRALRHPPLLFRAAPDIAAFRSRRYKTLDMVIPPPPAFGTEQFKHVVWPHLERDRAYQSPFVSLAQNPHNALRRVELARSEEIEKKMFLVIFAFDDLVQDGIQQFGEAAGPYLVRSLFTAREISDLPDGYKGAGEFLCYGAITCEPIAVLESYQAINLARALRRFKVGDDDALLQVHENLREIPAEWKSTVAQQFLSRYCGRSRVPVIGSAAYKLLMSVVHEGTQESLFMYKNSHFINTPQVETDSEYEAGAPEIPEHIPVIVNGSTIQLPANVDANEQDSVAVSPLFQEETQPVTGLSSNWVMVEKLNKVASKNSATCTDEEFAISRNERTSFWSASPAAIPNSTQATEDVLQEDEDISTDSLARDWDVLSDNDHDFTEGLGSAAARKITRAPMMTSNCDVPIPSVEETPDMDTLLMRLYEDVSEGTPTPARRPNT